MTSHGTLGAAALEGGAYPRLFPNLPALHQSDAEIDALAEELVSDLKPGNPTIPAGYTYFGQFLNHDITFGVASVADASPMRRPVVNLRTPRLELDSLYADGPVGSPHLYDRVRQGLLLVSHGRDPTTGSATDEADLPRNEQGTALLGDPRNDDNVIISQLHTAFARLHNLWMMQNGSSNSADRFLAVRQKLRWHYQWLVLNDFLHRLVGPAVVLDVLPEGHEPGRERFRGRHFSLSETPAIPLEFAAAAFRIGHAMVRESYVLNERLATEIGPLALFAADNRVMDLRGGRPLPAGWAIDWDLFFPSRSASITPQESSAIGPSIVRALSTLPGMDPANLARRTLLRGRAAGLPSGQDVARAMGQLPIRPDRQDPLWLYLLFEAQMHQSGQRLGQVGGRIVAEVIIGLLAADPEAFVNVQPEWKPIEQVSHVGELLALLVTDRPARPEPARIDVGPSWRDLGIPLSPLRSSMISIDRTGQRTTSYDPGLKQGTAQ